MVKMAEGYKHSEETRRKIGMANKGNVPWIKGRHHSAEAKHMFIQSVELHAEAEW